jgi:predicted nucleotidyltransferase
LSDTVTVKKMILARLSGLEKAEVVRVCYAVESGSRAWGFASVDSDFDVRFLYVRKPEWYLSINVERMLEPTIDSTDLLVEIQALLDAKRVGQELDLGPRIAPIDAFIEAELRRHEAAGGFRKGRAARTV